MKYIIDLPENTHWIQWIMEGSKDHHPYMDFKQVDDLTPYTEPDLDAVRNEAYKEAYDKGYQDATVKIGSDEQAIAEKAYQRGLVDAWETVRKIADLPTVEERENIFACAFTNDVIRLYTATEAIEKIRQYEQEQEEIKVGDEVNGKGGKGIIARISDDCNHFNVMWENGSTGYYMIEDFKKTGRNFPEIAEILKKMQEGK